MDIKISKGANIKIKGSADRVYANVPNSKYYALKPIDFCLLIPKLMIKVGDYVQAGDIVFLIRIMSLLNLHLLSVE